MSCYCIYCLDVPKVPDLTNLGLDKGIGRITGVVAGATPHVPMSRTESYYIMSYSFIFLNSRYVQLAP